MHEAVFLMMRRSHAQSVPRTALRKVRQLRTGHHANILAGKDGFPTLEDNMRSYTLH